MVLKRTWNLINKQVTSLANTGWTGPLRPSTNKAHPSAGKFCIPQWAKAHASQDSGQYSPTNSHSRRLAGHEPTHEGVISPSNPQALHPPGKENFQKLRDSQSSRIEATQGLPPTASLSAAVSTSIGPTMSTNSSWQPRDRASPSRRGAGGSPSCSEASPHAMAAWWRTLLQKILSGSKDTLRYEQNFGYSIWGWDPLDKCWVHQGYNFKILSKGTSRGNFDSLRFHRSCKAMGFWTGPAFDQP